jgi:hypothetical protein
MTTPLLKHMKTRLWKARNSIILSIYMSNYADVTV